MGKETFFCFMLFLLSFYQNASESVFTDAILKRDVATIHELIDQGHRLTIHDLMSAVMWNNFEMVDICMRHKVSVNELEEEMHMTPLMYAVFAGHDAMVAKLLALGARVDIENKRGDSAWQYAQKYRNTHAALQYSSIFELLKKYQPVQKSVALNLHESAADSVAATMPKVILNTGQKSFERRVTFKI